MARDSAARPHESLKLRIKDVVFKISQDKKQYAEVLLNGKTGSRHSESFFDQFVKAIDRPNTINK